MKKNITKKDTRFTQNMAFYVVFCCCFFLNHSSCALIIGTLIVTIKEDKKIADCIYFALLGRIAFCAFLEEYDLRGECGSIISASIPNSTYNTLL